MTNPGVEFKKKQYTLFFALARCVEDHRQLSLTLLLFMLRRLLPRRGGAQKGAAHDTACISCSRGHGALLTTWRCVTAICSTMCRVPPSRPCSTIQRRSAVLLRTAFPPRGPAVVCGHGHCVCVNEWKGGHVSGDQHRVSRQLFASRCSLSLSHTDAPSGCRSAQSSD